MHLIPLNPAGASETNRRSGFLGRSVARGTHPPEAKCGGFLRRIPAGYGNAQGEWSASP